jgi:ParB/RepB/Spo0J family partition protein
MKEKLIESIPIAQIHIANPRSRNRARWQMIVANIREVGLKKPITVVRRSELGADGKLFDLVCGQGRIEALMALGETNIPAIVIEAPREDQFLMSLVENIARRPPSNRDILREVRSLRERGYGVGEIARKLGMERSYISGIVHLIEHEEVALIASVESGKLPISVAVEIANGKDREISEALSEAYESGQLRGKKLAAARRLIAKRIEKRQREGKTMEAQRKVTGNILVQVYKQRVGEQKALIAKAELTKERLLLITSVMRQLVQDDNFKTLLRAEGIEIARVGGRYGSPQYQVRLLAKPDAKVLSVLSEGEQTCIALAAFLTEVTTMDHRSALVFDDPVTSLDHRWRKKVAERLVKEAAVRQVIVFTHDLIFVNDLHDLAQQKKIPQASRSIGRGAAGTGIVEDGLPWQGKSVEDRLDKLSKRAHAAKELFDDSRDEEYAEEAATIYNRLRSTWERALESIAFGGVVQRHRDYIETKHLRKTIVLTDADCDAFHAGFKRCCDITDAHDPSAVRNGEPPAPSEILKDIQGCADWTASLRSRQKLIP